MSHWALPLFLAITMAVGCHPKRSGQINPTNSKSGGQPDLNQLGYQTQESKPNGNKSGDKTEQQKRALKRLAQKNQNSQTISETNDTNNVDAIDNQHGALPGTTHAEVAQEEWAGAKDQHPDMNDIRNRETARTAPTPDISWVDNHTDMNTADFVLVCHKGSYTAYTKHGQKYTYQCPASRPLTGIAHISSAPGTIVTLTSTRGGKSIALRAASITSVRKLLWNLNHPEVNGPKNKAVAH